MWLRVVGSLMAADLMCSCAMQLDGCRIPVEQYDALLGGFAATHASSSAVSPIVTNPVCDIGCAQPDPLFPESERMSAPKPGKHEPCANKPVAESRNAQHSFPGLVVDTSLVDVQSCADLDDELHMAGTTAERPLDVRSRGSPVQSSTVPALAVLRQARQAHLSALSARQQAQQPLNSAAPPTGGIGTRKLPAETVSGLVAAITCIASGVGASQRRSSRQSHLSAESSATILAAEGPPVELVAPAAAASGSDGAREHSPPGKSITEFQLPSDCLVQRPISKRSQQAAARHKRRLKMISSGVPFATDAPSFSHCASLLGRNPSLVHAVSIDVITAALKYNPIFSVMDASEHWHTRHEDGAEQV